MEAKEAKEATQTPQSQPTPIMQTQTPINQPVSAGGLAIAAMVIGIVSLIIGWVPFLGFCIGITAIILGIVALKKKQSKGMSITGIITGAVSIVWNIVISIIFIVSILGAAITAGEITNEYGNYYSDYQTEQQSLIDAKKDFSKGAVAVFGGFDVEVNSITRNYVDSDGYYDASTGNELISVNVSVTNNTDTTAYFSSYYLTMNDNGLITDPGYASVNSAYTDGSLAAGATETGNIVYEVEQGSKDLKLQYESSAYDTNSNYVDLTYTLDLY